ncbi:MAG: divalent metal cation transporter [Pseudomonadota bacterium]
MIVLGAGVVMLPNAPLISIMFLSQVLNGLVLPIILFFMIRLISDPSVMGEHVNNKFGHVLAWCTAMLLSALSIMTVVSAIR